ncbi:peptidase S41-like protein [Taibaiella chishuiensis]|uniref:Peptidase S41-like protein n=2 Tax=Taibaiella chishuiensis TaxID=1434707 RepID=A0A2P8D1Q5_9BACT|nr:peptidase S41-like protein [Taibaiella chishuiensis]
MNSCRSILSCVLATAWVFFARPLCAQTDHFNLDFEQSGTGCPPQWRTLISNSDDAAVVLDTAVRKEGKQALLLRAGKTNDPDNDYVCAFSLLPGDFAGNEAAWSLYAKAAFPEKSSATAVFVAIGNSGEILAHQTEDIRMSADWKAYHCILPVDTARIKSFKVILTLNGPGSLWVDDIKCNIDGVPIDMARHREQLPAERDTAFTYGSGIEVLPVNAFTLRSYTKLGMLWGFLKYHHPSVVTGKLNWDAELFRILPGMQVQGTDEEVNQYLEAWVDRLGGGFPKMTERTLKKKDIKMYPDYGYLFDTGFLSPSLRRKLTVLKDCDRTGNQYYVDIDGNAIMNHENPFYSKHDFPDAGTRLLALFRYWNFILYYFPYRYLMTEDWNKNLMASLPEFLNARNANDYTTACLKLVAKIEDGHAQVDRSIPLLANPGTKVVALETQFVDDTLVVSAPYPAEGEASINRGDIITAIAGVATDTLINRYAALRSASNRSALRYYLLAGNESPFRTSKDAIALTIRDRSGYLKTVFAAAGKQAPPGKAPEEAIRLLQDSLVYVYAGSLKNYDIDILRTTYATMRGLIIDLRCYPAYYLVHDLCKWLKKEESVFAQMARPYPKQPGLFCFWPLANGVRNKDYYRGKIVVLVNEATQSQAEFTAMALQTVPGCTVVGTRTAGADGDYSAIVLPGNIRTGISGIGYYYPDRSETQKAGLKIDRVVRPTIKGISAGTDEVLDYAIRLFKK